ncbi:hypothetical protein B0A49_11243 [Cryomyces minteri]|uniref:Altered inheritance of mitochondria protein 9, mitochondrial n=1 Tax=Cryomyces minteri TaxID=331657 RepID=A0A4V6WKN9_9PEZI|nr:hypothetical protein B0A49_11243 [Cryomyces minteri]
MEGGFNKALLMTREDGTEVIAKIPCPNAGPAMYTTASEVAVLKFVPEVLSWSSDSANPVGAEYIIMEKVAGVQLFKKWDDINVPNRFELIQKLTVLESQLASLPLPAYGSLYLRQSISEEMQRIDLSSNLDPSGLYCVGPSCDRLWSDIPASEPVLNTGPWAALADFGVEQARREIWRIRHTEIKDARPIPRGTQQDQIYLLEATVKVMRILEMHPQLLRSSTPILWHIDLHMGNVFVSQDDPTEVTGIIDWQSTSISPMFLQVRWPVFLEPPENYMRGLHEPALPDDFDQLSSNRKERAIYENDRATLSKMYEISSYSNSRDVKYALNIPRVFRELFCPYRPSVHDIELHNEQFTDYEDWYTLQEFAMQQLDTDSEGWVPAETDWDEKRAQNQALCDFFLTKVAAEKPPEELRRMWPFLERANTH